MWKVAEQTAVLLMQSLLQSNLDVLPTFIYKANKIFFAIFSSDWTFQFFAKNEVSLNFQ